MIQVAGSVAIVRMITEEDRHRRQRTLPAGTAVQVVQSRPGPKGPDADIVRAVVDMKQRNPSNLDSGLPQVIVCMITSRMFRAGHPSRVVIQLATSQGAQSGLLSDVTRWLFDKERNSPFKKLLAQRISLRWA